MLQELIPLLEGATIQGQNGERFIVEGVLATGGFSTVYLVRDRRAHNKRYVLKEISDPSRYRRRQQTVEGEILKRLEHSSLPHIHQVFENTRLRRLYILMEYVEGPDLELLRLEQPDKRLSLSLTLELVQPIVEAVNYLHHQQPPIVHRDIKPANIIVPVGAGKPKLVDFGLAKEQVEENTTNMVRYGTPGYAPPEQYKQGTDPRTDIYALAATIYTLLSGIVPTDALTRNLEHHNEDPLLPLHMLDQTIPVPVSDAIEKAMSLRSEDRYATVEEFWQAIRSASRQQLYIEPIASDPWSPPLAVTGIPRLTTYQLDTQRRPINNRRAHLLQRRAHIKRKQLSRAVAILLTCVILVVAITGIIFYVAWSRYNMTTSGNGLTNGALSSLTTNIDPNQGCPKAELSQMAIGFSGDYPQLALCYGGEIQDIGIDSGSGPALIYNIHQQQNEISGQFSGLSMVGPFTGNLNLDGTLQFTVTPVGGNRPLLFTGHIRAGGNSQIVATFNDIDQNGHLLTDQYGNCTFIASATPSLTPTSSQSKSKPKS